MHWEFSSALNEFEGSLNSLPSFSNWLYRIGFCRYWLRCGLGRVHGRKNDRQSNTVHANSPFRDFHVAYYMIQKYTLDLSQGELKVMREKVSISLPVVPLPSKFCNPNFLQMLMPASWNPVALITCFCT